uniref:Uncharacterized protein n=1 Tax=Setaria viridis TaxID=4556 RepID=A0A4V6D3G5_SETVI|nr:hypothetical protein SEVIR_8G199566v2 [Setaria viridis]
MDPIYKESSPSRLRLQVLESLYNRGRCTHCKSRKKAI